MRTLKWSVASLQNGFNILRYIWACRASAIYGLPINLWYIHKRVTTLVYDNNNNQIHKYKLRRNAWSSRTTITVCVLLSPYYCCVQKKVLSFRAIVQKCFRITLNICRPSFWECRNESSRSIWETRIWIKWYNLNDIIWIDWMTYNNLTNMTLA